MKRISGKRTATVFSVIAAIVLLVVAYAIVSSTPAYGKFTSRIEQSFDLIIHPTKPIMAERGNWYRGTTDKSEIVTVTFAEADYLSNHPDLSYDEIFYADVKNIGTIQCFVVTNGNGKNLIISGNRYGEINDVYANADSSGMFSGFSALTEIVAVNQLDVSGVSDFSGMFAGSGVISLNLSGWETASAVDTSEMFKNCASLTEVTVTQSFNLSGVSDSTDMFLGCTNIVGRHGTVYDSGKTDKEYARTDTTNKKGYFLGDTVTITFDANGGSGTMPEQYLLPGVEDSIVAVNGAIEVEGYCVSGWNTAADESGTAYDACGSITITEDITLYAVWGPAVYTVTYNATGGEISGLIEGNTSEVVFGSTYGEGTNLAVAGTLPTATRTGYTFSHWGKNTLPLEYQEVEYLESTGQQFITLTKNSCQNGTEFFDIAMITVNTSGYNTIVGTAGGSSFEVYFNGSNKVKQYMVAKIDSVSGKEELNGIVEIKSHLEGGVFTPQLFAYSSSYTLTGRIYLHTQKYNGEYTAYLIPCYRISDNKPGMYDTVTETFYVNNGNAADFSVGPNAYGSLAVSALTEITETVNQTLYAIWIPDTHNVTLRTNDSVGSTKVDGFADGDVVLATYGTRYQSLCSFSRKGYSFSGWATSADGEVEHIPSDEILLTEDTVLYAVWAPNSYTVTYDANGGELSGLIEGNDSIVTFDSTYGEGTNLSVTGTLPAVTRAGFIFCGWSDIGISSGNYYLPIEYQQVEYLESTGTQFLKLTENHCSTGTVFYDKAMITKNTSAYNTIVGRNSGGGFEVYYNGSNKITGWSIAIIDSVNGEERINGIVEVVSHLSSCSDSTPQLFAYDSAYKLTGRIYLHTQKDNGVYTGYLIPCYRRSDNKPGMYDLITQTFYTNCDPGNDFIVGPNVGITASTPMTKTSDHVLCAMWEEITEVTLSDERGTETAGKEYTAGGTLEYCTSIGTDVHFRDCFGKRIASETAKSDFTASECCNEFKKRRLQLLLRQL